jgi:polysaccharide export outer membrane protein
MARFLRHLAGDVALALLMVALVAGPAFAQAARDTKQPTAAMQPTSSTSAVSPEYRLGAGDMIRITVYQNPDLTLETRIAESGLVTYPLLGSIRLGGMTSGEAERRIADGLRTGNYVKQPQVNVLVLTVRGNQISVLGQVNRPGRYPIETAGMRLSDALAAAGGITAVGSETVTLTGVRVGKPLHVQVDLPVLFASQSPAENPQVADGDVIFVDRMPVVYIYGEVQRPGSFRLERGMTLMQALAVGGGLTPRGTTRGLRVNRRDSSGNVQIVEPKSLEEKLVDGDVIYVKESLF